MGTLARKLCVAGVVTLALAPAATAAEESESVGQNKPIGGYGGLFFSAGPFAGSQGLIAGGRGGWLLLHRFLIGGSGFGLVNDVRTAADGSPMADRRIHFGAGGFFAEWVIAPERKVHGTLSTFVGWGNVSISDPPPGVSSDDLFIVWPEVAVEADLGRWVRVGAGIGYRVVLDSALFDESDLGGLAASIYVRAGYF